MNAYLKQLHYPGKGKDMEKLFYSWEHFEKDIKVLASKYQSSSFDCILAISRGGLVPGVKLSHLLNIPLEIIEYRTRDFPTNYIKLPKLNDFNCLLVEDIIDTGKTLDNVLSALTLVFPNISITVVTLFSHNVKLWFPVEFVCNKIQNKDTWIVFPWEVTE